MKILVIEDDPEAIFQLTNAILSGRDSNEISFTLTNSLEAADKLVTAITFDLIFLDHSLPDGIAPNYLEKWKEQGGLKGVHVIGISGHEECNSLMMDLGAQGSISKSSDFELCVRQTMADFEAEDGKEYCF